MSDYLIFTDSACDIAPETLAEWGVSARSLTYHFTDDDTEYSSGELDSATFYAHMRNGRVAKTSAVSTGAFDEMFRAKLAAGHDLLYLGFSSGLSTTYNAAKIAAEALAKEFPERKILTVDTLAASAGFGLLVYLTVQKKNAGATIEEAAQYAEEMKWHLCHWFTVDDLVYLKRGGRISATAAFVGGVLGIKPVLHVDNEGHLINMSKVRGRRTAIAALAKKYGETANDPKGGTVFISHGDCMEDALALKEMLHKDYGAKVQLITDVSPVIGAHSGPGTLALFFVGKER